MLQRELEESFRRAEVKGGIESGIKRLQVIHKADGSQPALRLAKELREQVDRLTVAANDDDALTIVVEVRRPLLGVNDAAARLVATAAGGLVAPKATS